MDVFSFNKNKDAIFYGSIPVTIIIVSVSIIYSFRKIFRIWDAGKPKPITEDEADSECEEDAKTQESDGSSCQQTEIDDGIDPLEYCGHIQSEIKKAKQRATTKEVQKNLTDDDIEKEKEIQRKQIEDIFKLMEQHSDKFGDTNHDDVQQQMKLYV